MYQGMTPAGADAVRHWVFDQVTDVVDEDETWHMHLQAVARTGGNHEDVADKLRELIGKDPGTARTILLRVLHLEDASQAEMFREYYAAG